MQLAAGELNSLEVCLVLFFFSFSVRLTGFMFISAGGKPQPPAPDTLYGQEPPLFYPFEHQQEIHKQVLQTDLRTFPKTIS